MTAWGLALLSRRQAGDGGRRWSPFGAVWLGLIPLLLAAAVVTLCGGSAPSLPCCLLSGGGIAPRQPGPALELVVAHYAGNLSFVPGLLAQLGTGAQLTIYSKSPEPPPGAQQLPNVGREGHTFLAHLHARYDSLAEVTLFVMDSAELSRDKRDALSELMASWHTAHSAGFFCGGLDRHRPKRTFTEERWQGTTDDSQAGSRSAAQRELSGPRLQPASPRPFGDWFAEYIGGELPRAWCPGALMAVHRSRAQQRPRSFYATLLAQLAVGPDPEAGHYLERSWGSAFYDAAALPRCQA